MKSSRSPFNAASTDLSSGRKSSWEPGPSAIAAITGFGFASGYLQQFVAPAVPLAPWGDQVMWLQNGIRILGGQLPYRDYFQLTTPGCDLFYAALVGIFGARAWIPDLTMAVLGAGVVLVITLISKRVLTGAAVFLPALLFLGFALPSSLYATHHWFSTLGVLAAVLVLLDRVDIKRAALAGTFCGMAGCFTQTKAAIAAVAVIAFLFLRSDARHSAARRAWRECAAFCAGFAVALLAVNAYFIRAAGLSNFLFWTVVFPVRYFSAAKPFNTLHAYGMDLGRDMGLTHIVGFLFVHAVVPLIFLVFFALLVWRKRPFAHRDSLLLIALAGFASFLAIAPAPAPLRIFTVSPLALILLVCLAAEFPLARLGLGISTVAAILLAILIPLRFQTHWHGLLETPTGRVAVIDRNRFDEITWAAENTHAGEFFFGNSPICFTLGLQNPTPLNFTTPDDFTRPSHVVGLVQALDVNRVPLLLLLPGGYLPRPADHATDHMQPFRDYLFKHYEIGKRFATGDEAWVRIQIQPGASGGAASSLAAHDEARAAQPAR
jgi:hypothetical protein